MGQVNARSQGIKDRNTAPTVSCLEVEITRLRPHRGHWHNNVSKRWKQGSGEKGVKGFTELSVKRAFSA
eukprot:763317-Hanusia_phi.AAC.5